MKEVLSWAGNGEADMAFPYTIIRVFEEEQAKSRIYAQKDLDILRNWHKLAARAQTIEEFEEHI